MSATPKKFYSVSDLVEATGYSAGTIQKRIKSGEIFAVQGADHGAFRIPASSYNGYLASLGLGPELDVKLLPPTGFEMTDPDRIWAIDIAPALDAGGFADMSSLMAAVEADPTLYPAYKDAIRAYQTFLSARAAVFA